MINTRLSTSLHLLVALADSRDGGARSPVSSAELARRINSHPVAVRRLLSDLKDRGIVRVERGPGGGYVLNMEPADLSLGDVADAVREADVFDLHDVETTDPADLDFHVPSALESVRRDVNTSVARALDQYSLTDLLHGASVRRDLAALVADGISEARIRDEYEIRDGRLVRRSP